MYFESAISESDVHSVLSSPRRRETLRHLVTVSDAVTVRDLADAIATAETGRDPAPQNVRETVYVSLHQTHLPVLHDLGVVDYDQDAHRVEPLGRMREFGKYMDVDSPVGVSWAELYRALGLVGLCLVVAADASLPVVDAVPTVLWASAALALLAVTSAWHLWTYRWDVIRRLSAR